MIKYTIAITGIDGDAKLNEVIDWTYKAVFENGSLSADYPLSNLVGGNGATVYPAGKEPTDTITLFATSAFKIYGHMDEEAGNEYQGLSIDGIGITVYATQQIYENDSFGNQYDANAKLPSVWDGKTVTAPTKTNGVYQINTAAEFVYYTNVVSAASPTADFSNAGVKAVLNHDIDLNGYTLTRTGVSYYYGGSFDGQNHTVSNFTIKRTDNAGYTGLFGYLSGGTVENLTVKNATVLGAAWTSAIVPAAYDNASVKNCHAVNCTVIGEKKVGTVVGYNDANVSDCSATDCSVFATDARADQADAVVGFNDGSATVAGITATKVEVYTNVKTVSTAADLREALVAGGTVVLTNDLDFAGAEFTTVEVNNRTVNLVGLGHKISNVKLGTGNYNGMHAYGMFYLWNNGNLTVSDLTFVNASVVTEGANFGAAVVAGYVDYHTTLTLNNVDMVKCSVKNANDEAALYASYVVSTVNMTDCDVVDCTVSGETAEKTGVAIGHANGLANVTLTNCTKDVANAWCNRIAANGTVTVR